VARFLEGSLGFGEIPSLLEAAVMRFGGTTEPDPDIEELVAIDAAVRAAFATTRFGAST
jgi:1-deoxy-D-xylulose 5-phosphate reductoisomerase